MAALTPANKVQGRTPSGLSRNPSMGMFDVVGTNKEALGGVLKILVKKGKLYRDTEAIGKMDPFVEIEYKNKKYRTRVKEEGGKLPVWNQTLEIPLESLLDEIKVCCYDQDSFTNDLIGET
jgi:Ca2+-dependent lipid-binding protein